MKVPTGRILIIVVLGGVLLTVGRYFIAYDLFPFTEIVPVEITSFPDTAGARDMCDVLTDLSAVGYGRINL